MFESRESSRRGFGYDAKRAFAPMDFIASAAPRRDRLDFRTRPLGGIHVGESAFSRRSFRPTATAIVNKTVPVPTTIATHRFPRELSSP